MANEITVSMSIKFAKGSVSESMSVSAATFDMTGTNYVKGTQSVGTSEEALEKHGMSTPGWCMITNTDSTNVVHVRADTGLSNTIELKALESAAFRNSGSAPHVIAITAPCVIEYLLIEE
jgi:hypothetical protein